MTIELTPEDAQLVQKRLGTGVFNTVEEVIHDALASQAAETEWLEAHKDEINEKIARGIAQLDRGEGVTGEAARAELKERKAAWLQNRKV